MFNEARSSVLQMCSDGQTTVNSVMAEMVLRGICGLPARPKEEVFTLKSGMETGSFRGRAEDTRNPRISGSPQGSKRSQSHLWELKLVPEKSHKVEREGRNACLCFCSSLPVSQ